MRKLLFLTIGLLSLQLTAQGNMETNLSVLYGRNASTFGFVKSDGLKTSDMEFTGGNSFILGLGLTMNNRHVISPEMTYYEAGALRNLNGIPLQWKLNYLGLGCSYGFKVIAKEKYSLIPGLALGADYLLKGTQTIGNSRYDVKDTDALTNWNIRSNFYLNNRIRISESLFFLFEYRFGLGINQIEKNDADINQKTRNLGHHFLFGLNFAI
jgi:hypothetical protein